MKKKSHFLLIEILIALVLISMLSLPLVRNPLYFFKSEVETLKRIECERIAENSFCEIKILLHQNQIPWDSIPLFSKKASSHILSPKRLILNELGTSQLHRSYKLWAREKENQKGEIYRVIRVNLYLRPESNKNPYIFHYSFLAKRA